MTRYTRWRLYLYKEDPGCLAWSSHVRQGCRAGLWWPRQGRHFYDNVYTPLPIIFTCTHSEIGRVRIIFDDHVTSASTFEGWIVEGRSVGTCITRRSMRLSVFKAALVEAGNFYFVSAGSNPTRSLSFVVCYVIYGKCRLSSRYNIHYPQSKFPRSVNLTQIRLPQGEIKGLFSSSPPLNFSNYRKMLFLTFSFALFEEKKWKKCVVCHCPCQRTK